MLKKPELHEVHLSSWLCNGGLNPLIRDYDLLARLAGAAPTCSFGWPALAEALRHLCIDLGLTCWPWENIHPTLSEFERRELFRRHLEKRDRPAWRSGPERLPGVWTTAQYIARHGGKSAQAECHDFADLLQCLQLAGAVNNFNPWHVANQFKSFRRIGYLNEDNPNNWRDAFTYTYGSDGPTILVSDGWLGPATRVMAQDDGVCPSSRYWHAYSAADFRQECQALGHQIQADESDALDEHTWRFWWD